MSWNPVSGLRHVEHAPHDGTGEVYGELLSQCPVGKVDVPGSTVDWWGVFSYADLVSAAKDFRSLSNVTPPPDGPRIIPLQTDPPDHTAYRKLLNGHFTVDAVSRLEADIRTYAREMIDSMIEKGSADFAEEFAFPYPTRVLCRFLGVADGDWTIHHDWVMKMAEATTHGLADPDVPIPGELLAEIMPHLQALITDHLENRRDDVVTGILTGPIGDREPDHAEMLNMIITIMLAGHITTTSGISNLVLRLAGDADLQARLRERPDRIPDAIEESLRIDTPQQVMPRKCVADVELGGQTIKAGDFVLLSFGSANVDPDAFPAADTFDLDRANRSHVAFGRGLHYCIGQHLARLELRIATEELLARTAHFELDGPVRRLTWPLLCVAQLPMSLTPRRSS